MELQEMMNHFFHLYGRRNRIFLPGLRERIDYLNLAIGDFQDAIRKRNHTSVIGIALARIGARIFCIAEHFWALPFTEIMSQKYPVAKCSYCQKHPCTCPEERPNVILESASKIQLTWSLKQWQQHLNGLYGQRNKKRGSENLLNRLFKEVAELLSLQMRIPIMRLTSEKIEEEFTLELADTLAWTIAIANFFEIDIEETILCRYGKGCWKCNQDPCVCTNFNFKAIKWSEIEAVKK